MKIRVRLVVCDDDGDEETFTDVAVLEKAQILSDLVVKF
jgi:hypothetical protein